MKNACFALLLAAAAVPASAQTLPTISLKQAVDEALRNNDRLLNQHDGVQQSELAVRLARSDFRPKVTPSIVGALGQSDVNSQTYRVDVSKRLATGADLRVSTGTASQIPGVDVPDGALRFYGADTTFTLSQPLLRGMGSTVARRSVTSAEFRRDDAGIQQVLAEQQVAIDVVSAYYRVVSQTSFVSVARQSLERSRRLRDASEAKLEAGLVSQLDVLRARQLVTQAESQLFDAQAAVDDARDQLMVLIGRRPGDIVDVETEVPRVDEGPMDADRAVALALASRLDLKSRSAARQDADRQAQFARNQLLPQVDVNVALTRRDTSTSLARSFGFDGYQFATFLTIASPVDRTAQQVELQTAILDRNRRDREITMLERQIGEEVRRAIRDRDRWIRTMASAETSVAIAERQVEVAQLRYERGLSNNLDVVTAEAELLAAESRRIQARADAAVARLRLRAAMGTFNPRTAIDAAGVTSMAAATPQERP